MIILIYCYLGAWLGLQDESVEKQQLQELLHSSLCTISIYILQLISVTSEQCNKCVCRKIFACFVPLLKVPVKGPMHFYWSLVSLSTPLFCLIDTPLTRVAAIISPLREETPSEQQECSPFFRKPYLLPNASCNDLQRTT